MNLKHRVALVTGGAVRIGRAIVEALAGQGCHVVIHCRHSIREGQVLAGRLRRGGVKAWVVREDLARHGAPERLIKKARACAGRLDVLVNNASVFHKDSFERAGAEQWEAEWKINFLAPVLLARAFVKQLSPRKPAKGKTGIRGKIVNLLDQRITGHDAECLPYVLSKKMLAEFTRSVALSLAPGVTVNGVAPGAILPPKVAGQRVKGVPLDLAGDVPLQRQCTPAEVAGAVVYLLESDAITGQILFVDGGQNLLGSPH